MNFTLWDKISASFDPKAIWMLSSLSSNCFTFFYEKNNFVINL